MLQVLNNTICLESNLADHESSNNKSLNIFHLFLKYLYLNLKESSTLVGANQTSSPAAWRTFKGRLYTRLHDKRIGELELNGLLNLAYMFFALIKSFDSSSFIIVQLKYEQVENYFRILNTFVKAKSLDKLDSILLLSSSSMSSANLSISMSDKVLAKTNAIKAIINTKFTTLRLWFQTSESAEVQANTLTSNEQEIKQIIQQEFHNLVNGWLMEANNIFKSNPSNASNQTFKNSNQISRYLYYY